MDFSSENNTESSTDRIETPEQFSSDVLATIDSAHCEVCYPSIEDEHPNQMEASDSMGNRGRSKARNARQHDVEMTMPLRGRQASKGRKATSSSKRSASRSKSANRKRSKSRSARTRSQSKNSRSKPASRRGRK